MRILQNEVIAIKQAFQKYFDNGRIFLFGSRVDDTEKGGDIDLYLEVENNDRNREKKLEFLVEVKKSIGDQKIDVVMSSERNRLIDQEVKTNGIQL